MHLVIVGGCFPVQHNIPPPDLYHQTLRRQLAAAGVPTDVTVVRYERLATCLAKVAAVAAARPIDVLVFHLRTEPLMRLTKLYYKHLDGTGRRRHSLNLPTWGHLNPEKYDLLTVRPRRPAPAPAPAPGPDTRLRRWLRALNYRAGAWAGNRAHGLGLYAQLTDDLAAFCAGATIRLLVVGPVSRPCSRYEDRLSEQIDAFFAPRLARQGVAYLRTLGHRAPDGTAWFFPNGVHVSPAGHHRMAALLFGALPLK